MSIIITKDEVQSEDSFFSKVREIFRDELSAIFPTEPKTENVELLNYKQASSFLGVSIPTLKNWKKKNIVPHVGKLRCIRFKKSDLIAALEKKESILNFEKPMRGRRVNK